MNALIIGRCARSAEQLQTFCECVYVVLDTSFDYQRAIPELDSYEIIYSNKSIRRVWGILGRAIDISRWVKYYKIEVLLTNTKWDMVAAKIASFLVKKKLVLLATNHNSYSWQQKNKVKALAWLIRSTTDCYIALASFVYALLIENKIQESNLLLLPNTISVDAWEKKEDYSFNSVFRLVYVAVLYPGKRQDFLVDIIDRIKEYNIQVDCYGDFLQMDYVCQIKQKIEEKGLQGRIRLLGRIENSGLRSILKNYDAYICPSFLEMSPVNVLEAMAVGLPVIATRVGGIPDIIKDDSTGLLFDYDDVDQAASLVEKIITDQSLRERIAIAGKRYVSEEYTPAKAGQLLKERVLAINKYGTL